MHDALITSGRRRVVATAIGGIVLLGLTVAVLLFPIIWLTGAFAGLLGGPWGFGWELFWWSVGMAAVIGTIAAAGVVWTTWRHAARDVLFDARAWPRPLPGRDVMAVGDAPPALAHVDRERLERALTVMAIPYGIRAPRVAVVDDVALNSLTIGRGHEAWIVLTTGLIREMPHHELDAVLAFQLARVAVREVSLDTVVYACTGRTLELWGGAFDEIDEVALLLLPAAIIATPFALAAGALRLSAVRAGARLGDGLALRAMRDPAALVAALERIERDPRVIRNAELSTAHLWLEYPHTRMSRFFLRSAAVLPARISRLSRAGRSGGTLGA